MDGYALNSQALPTGLQQFRVIGRSLAGHPFQGTVQAGECVRIMTGAVVPQGADTVLMQEEVQRSADHITYQGEIKANKNIRHPGEDLAQGAEVLSEDEFSMLPIWG